MNILSVTKLEIPVLEELVINKYKDSGKSFGDNLIVDFILSELTEYYNFYTGPEAIQRRILDKVIETYPMYRTACERRILYMSFASTGSDSYHTFGERYEHRDTLFAALMTTTPGISWKSKFHDDGTRFPDMFVAGMQLPTGDITYHLPEEMWDMLGYIKTLERAPKWDGHTPEDVLSRLERWIS